jgi:uncharacterized protein
MRGIRIAAAAALVLAAAAFAGVAAPERASGLADQEGRSITVSGLGSVTTTPDRAEFSFGVERRAATAREAFSAVTAAIRKVVDAARAQGIAAADIQTQQIGVNPVYTEDGSKISGYSASSSVSVKLADLSRSGALIDAVVQAGANQVFGPSLTASDRDERYREALAKAVADARSKAQALASATSVTLGSATSVVEGGASAPQPAADAAVKTDGAGQIEPGRQQIEAVVTVTFSAQ